MEKGRRWRRKGDGKKEMDKGRRWTREGDGLGKEMENVKRRRKEGKVMEKRRR
jgi:hypothetical protein